MFKRLYSLCLNSLRKTLDEAHDDTLSRYRSYNKWAAEESLIFALEHGLSVLVFVGSGTQSIRQYEATWPDGKIFHLLTFSSLEELDRALSQEGIPYPGRKAVILNNIFHQIYARKRLAYLTALLGHAEGVLVLESAQRSLLGKASTVLHFFAAVTLPLRLWRRSWPRNVFWCWLIPIAPYKAWREAVKMTAQLWNSREWALALHRLKLKLSAPAEITFSSLSQRIRAVSAVRNQTPIVDLPGVEPRLKESQIRFGGRGHRTG